MDVVLDFKYKSPPKTLIQEIEDYQFGTSKWLSQERSYFTCRRHFQRYKKQVWDKNQLREKKDYNYKLDKQFQVKVHAFTMRPITCADKHTILFVSIILADILIGSIGHAKGYEMWREKRRQSHKIPQCAYL